MRDPAFWWTAPGTAAALLAPVGACYGAVAARRMAQPGRKAAVPVICVGNFTLGGAGKTPAAIALARLLIEAGRRPFFLSRGYGGRVAGPVRVDPSPAGEGEWTAAEVGDEPLLLAGVAPAIVARDRADGARAAAAGGADTIVMDDGLQNPSVVKDLAVAVVDGRRGIGNGRVFPAGPLRAPLAAQLDHVDAVLVVGAAGAAAAGAVEAAAARGLPVLHGDLRAAPEAVAALAGKPLLAFAGIADPGKFFATLDACGIPAEVRRPFPDHHAYAAAEMAELVAFAERRGLTLVTTEKDMARLRGDRAAAALAARSAVLPVVLVFREAAAVTAMLDDATRRSSAA
jgi:tetraacyldisaccharide 4'-kinase